MWRHEDIFFGAFGGGDFAGKAITTPEEIAERAAGRTHPVPPGVPVHARHRALDGVHRRCSAAAPSSSPTDRRFDPVRLWELVGAGAGELPRHRRRRVRPPAGRRARPARRAGRPLRPRRDPVRRRDPLAVGEDGPRRAAAGLDDHRRLRLVRGRRSGPVGHRGGRGAERGARASGSTTRRPCSPPTSRPRRSASSASSRAAATSRSATTRIPEKTAATFPVATACGGRCPATTPASRRTARSRCSAAARCRSTPAARRCTPKRSSPR